MTLRPSKQPSDSPSRFAALFSRHYWREWGLLCSALFICFWRLGAIPLFDLDEALYVTCARQMNLRQDYVTPRLNSRPPGRPQEETTPFFEKPILVYWASAFSMRAFGSSEGAARLPVACAALFTTGLVVLAGRRWFSRRAGLLAGVVFLTAPLTVVDGRQMTTDGLLVLWFTLALLAYHEIRAHQRSAPETFSLGLPYPAFLFWLACALAILTKGAVGLLLPALVIGVSLFFDYRQEKQFVPLFATVRALRPLTGLLILLTLAVPWHIAVWKAGERDAKGATFVEEYIIRQHIGRFRGGDKVHNAPLPTYFVYFLIGFFPWACFAPAAFRYRATPQTTELETTGDTDTEKRKRSAAGEGMATDGAANASPAPRFPGGLEEDTRRFLRIWFWTIFIFFTLSAAKLPTYIAPTYPAAALLVGRWLDMAFDSQKARRTLLWGAAIISATASLLFLAAAFAPRFAPASSPIPAEVVQLARLLTGILLLGGITAWVCFGFGGPDRGVRYGVFILAGMMLLFFTGGFTAGYVVARKEVMQPYQSLAQNASADAARGVPVFYYHIIPRRPSMLYYSDYSPYERKETPLLPFLRMLSIPAEDSECLVITSRRTLQSELLPELRANPEFVWKIRETTGKERDGWVCLEIRRTRGRQGD